MASKIAPPPLQTELVESSRDLHITKVWGTWLRSLVDRAQVAAVSIVSIGLANHSASVSLATLIPLASGRYRVSYRFRVTTPAGVSSSLQVSVTTTEGGISCTQTGPAFTGNVTNQPQSGSVLVNADPSTPISYSIAYASNPGAALVFEADVVVEQLG